MKGFTLVELLAVIIILGLIALITIPAINNIISDSQEKAYNEQIKRIESIARNWGVTNTKLLPDSGTYYLSLDTLKEEGLLKDEDIKNPKDKSVMNGCVAIRFDEQTNQYVYYYLEECNNKTYENGTPIYFNPVTNKSCTEQEANKNMNSNGTPTGITEGCMKWYTFNDSSDSDTVNLILDHNTTVIVAWNDTNSNTEMKEVKEALQSDTKNWNKSVRETARLITADEIAQITRYSGFDSNQSIYIYFDSNTDKQSVFNKGESKYSWLFNYTNDCTKYGCDVEDNNKYIVYNSDNSEYNTYGYWTSTPISNTEYRVWRVHSKGFYGRSGGTRTSSGDNAGLRPVITIPKMLIR